MPELPPVSPGEIIASEHINDIADRTVQRYASTAQRSAENPTPTLGELSFVEDRRALEVWMGSLWVRYVNVDGDTMSGPLNMGGEVLNGLSLPVSDSGAVPLSLLNDRAPAPAPWVIPTLGNSWESFGTAIAYMRDSAGNTQFRGNMRNGVQTSGATIFVLTPDFRPAQLLFIGLQPSNDTAAICTIETTGEVQVSGTWTVGSYVSMSGVLFSTLA